MASNEDTQIFMSLFKGRGDIYAKRWEKNGKSGYGPDYKVDWQEYNAFKLKGGTFANFPNKHPLPLTWEVINRHLDGIHTVGIYPLLQDNTSYFIVADFDGENWQEECKDFIKICKKFEIPISLERSRSGKGGHVWIFFEENYPAFKSRKIALELIRQVLKLSQFDKEVSFDRLFPNQDYHSNLGVGNLIALPFQKEPSKNGNSVFLDANTFEVISDQWIYLKTIKKISTKKLDKLFSEFSSETVLSESEEESYKSNKNNKKLSIILSNQIHINKNELNSKLVNFLKEKLNFLNKEYLIKKKVGISTYKVEKYFKQIEETDSHVLIPRGFKNELVNFCKENNILFSIKDERLKLKPVKYNSKTKLYDHQIKATQNIGDVQNGVIVAPAGSGKTIIGLELIANHKQPTLILVHRKQLADQWIERIESFLGIPKTKIGQLTGRKKKVGNKITVAMVQSLTRLSEDDLNNLTNKFGMIIVDECHHLPAKSFRNIISKFKSFYLYGLTATPKRKYNDEELIYNYLGGVIATVDPNYQGNDISSQKSLTTINLVNTQISVPFDFQTDQFETLSKVLIFDTSRNLLIVENVLKEIQNNQKILILTERKEHVDVLNLYLKNQSEVITLTGDDSVAKRKVKIEQITAGNYQILITTGQMFGEGMDFKEFNCLFLVYPFSFEGKLIQYLGRIQRAHGAKTTYDYRDVNIPFFDKFFKNRLRYYKKLPNTKIVEI